VAAAADAPTLVATEPKRPSPAEVRAQQMRDPKLAQLIDYKEGKVPNVGLLEMRRLAAQTEVMALREGVLGHLNKPTKKRPQKEWDWTQIVPDVDGERRCWFDRAHAQDGGHMKHGATYARLLEWVYWDSMWADCLQWCKECPICDIFEKPAILHGLLQPTTTASLKGQRRVHVDLMGPFAPDENGNTHAMIIIDRDDMWPTVIDIKGTGTDETCRALCQVVADSGVPLQLVSDNGSNFTSEHAKAFYEAMGMEPMPTSPEAAWSNGAAEAVVKIAKGIVAKLVEERRKSWSKLIWLVNMVMRSRNLTGYDMSPFEARFGRPMRTPAMFNLPFDNVKLPGIDDLRKIKVILEKKRDEVAEAMKKKFDKKRTEADFEEGDMVWIVPRQGQGSLQPLKIGPYKVTEVKGPANLLIDQVEGGPKLTRKKMQSVRNLQIYEHKEIYKPKEVVVKDILGHEGRGSGRKYKVLWEDGSETWEPRKHLVDKGEIGEEIAND